MKNAVKNEEFSAEESIIIDSPRKKIRMKFWLLLIVIIAVVLGGAYYFRLLPAQFLPAGGSDVQAVFLNNGQVYFGKLTGEDDAFPVLKDVYYLQVSQPLQSGTSQGTSNINLIKLGGELHGPTDMMKISRSSILFIEDLSQSSKVLQAINSLKTPAK
jgi:hypothetical protein